MNLIYDTYLVACCVGHESSLVVIARGEGGLCSVSIDRLDYDCLASGVDICVSSLTSACLTAAPSDASPSEPQNSEWGPTL